MRPAGLTAVCIICLVMGALGGLSLFGGCVGMVAQPLITSAMQGFMKTLPGSNTPQFQKQMELQDALMHDTLAVQRQWMPFMVVAMLILTVAVACLIVGALKALKLKRMAHRWLILGMSAAILHGLVAAYVGLGTQRDSQAIVMRHFNQTMQTTPGGANPAARGMTSNMMHAGTTIGIAIALTWVLAKTCAYVGCIWYLLTPRIRQLFESDGSDRAIIDALSDAPT